MIKNKRGANLLTENIVFIVLNLIFLTILFLFVFLKVDNSASLEEGYAKQIALVLDSARPGMIINLDMESAIKKKEKGISVDEIVSIDENVVTVKLRSDGSYSYSFFNDIEIGGKYFDGNDYVLVVEEK